MKTACILLLKLVVRLINTHNIFGWLAADYSDILFSLAQQPSEGFHISEKGKT
jgi:hypothetical protein